MTTTTVGALRDLLNDYDDDTEVLIAHQPNWPLAETIAGVVSADDRPRDDDDEHDDEGDVLWLVAGGHPWDRSPYAPRWVFDHAEVTP